MKKLVQIVSLLLVFALFLSLPISHHASAQNANAKLRVLVQFVPGAKAAVESALKGAGAEFHYRFDDLNTFSISVPEVALKGLRNNPNIVMIEEDAVRYPTSIQASGKAVELPSQVVPYGIDMVQARDIWDVNRDGVVDAGAPTGSNRMICIIDSGLLHDHEDLSGTNLVGGYTTISTGIEHDEGGHGTHVAGTIAAVNNELGVVGVTPGTVNLYVVRVFGDDGNWAYASTLIDAANRCASAGANIISMSLGGPTSNRTEMRGFDSLYSKGVLSIAAAGNDGNTATSYPAGYASVMSVAAVDQNKVVGDFSQQNADVEIAAPGVGVLSTIPYLDYNVLTVAGRQYTGTHIEYSARGVLDAALVDGGICDSVGTTWSGKIVLCQRGTVSFLDKVKNAQTGGAAAAVIYNNVPGLFSGTLGDGNTSTIPAIALSMEDGTYLQANALGMVANLNSTRYFPITNNYEYYDGTSMATPHVSAVAALVWGSKPTATNVEVRNALTATAQDLGAAGRDVAYGYGLVQAKAAMDYLGGGTVVVPPTTGTVHVADLDGTFTVSRNKWTASVTVKVVDSTGASVSGASVTGAWSNGATGTGDCTTGTDGTCKVSSPAMKSNVSSVTYTVTGVSATGYTYAASENADPDGDSNGTTIVVVK